MSALLIQILSSILVSGLGLGLVIYYTYIYQGNQLSGLKLLFEFIPMVMVYILYIPLLKGVHW